MIKSFSLLIIGLVLLTSCKDANNSEDSVTQFPDEIQFVWQESTAVEYGDDYGIYFTDTEVYLWDYAGDSYDEGEDCYYVESVAKFSSVSGITYSMESTEAGDNMEKFDLDIEIVDGSLVTIFKLGTETSTDRYSKTNLTPAQLTPACSIAPKVNPHTFSLGK